MEIVRQVLFQEDNLKMVVEDEDGCSRLISIKAGMSGKIVLTQEELLHLGKMIDEYRAKYMIEEEE